VFVRNIMGSIYIQDKSIVTLVTFVQHIIWWRWVIVVINLTVRHLVTAQPKVNFVIGGAKHTRI